MQELRERVHHLELVGAEQLRFEQRRKLLAVELHLGGVYHQCGDDHHSYHPSFACLLNVIIWSVVVFCKLMRERNSNRNCLYRLHRLLFLKKVLNAKFFLTASNNLIWYCVFRWLDFVNGVAWQLSKLVYNITT